jgi:hypothetical protein
MTKADVDFKVVALVALLIGLVVFGVMLKGPIAGFFKAPTDRLVDNIISLQEKENKLVADAQAAIAPIDKEIVETLKRLNITDRKKYLAVQKTYFPRMAVLPDPEEDLTAKATSAGVARKK